jgi:hypothetical protein
VSRRIEQQVRTYYSIPARVKVVLGPTKPSEFPNYDALTITVAVATLLARMVALLRMTKLDLSKDPLAEVMKKIDVKGRPTRGNSAAKVVAINYDDFECPFCSRMHQTLFPELLKEYGDRVVFIYKDFPLAEIHPWATHAAVNANCLAAQNQDAYWAFADYIHANQKEVNAEKSHDLQFPHSMFDHGAGQKHNLMSPAQACIRRMDIVNVARRRARWRATFINGESGWSAARLRDVLDRAQCGRETAPVHPAAAASETQPASKCRHNYDLQTTFQRRQSIICGQSGGPDLKRSCVAVRWHLFICLNGSGAAPQTCMQTLPVDGRKIYRADVEKYYQNQTAGSDQCPSATGHQSRSILKRNSDRRAESWDCWPPTKVKPS